MVLGQKAVPAHVGSTESDISTVHLKPFSFSFLHFTGTEEFPPVLSPYTIASKFVSGVRNRITGMTVVSQLLRTYSGMNPPCASQSHNRNLQSASLSYILTSVDKLL